jgi:hypothetical protein
LDPISVETIKEKLLLEFIGGKFLWGFFIAGKYLNFDGWGGKVVSRFYLEFVTFLSFNCFWLIGWKANKISRPPHLPKA